jgi:2-phospho-L-lactate/phosphoenolpyruvate guanylyltransferase
MAGLEPLHAVVPMRGLDTGKARLAGVIDAEERQDLLLGLLRQTVSLLRDWTPLTAVHVVSADRRVLAVAAAAGAQPVTEQEPGLNPAIQQGIRSAAAAGAAAILVVPGDLPLLDRTSLDRLLEAADAAVAAGSGRPIVVIAPADARNGTNGLLLSPVDVIQPAFGANSFEAHARAAKNADATLQVVTEPGFGFDLDTTEDLERLPSEVLESLLELGRGSTARSTS